MSFLGRHVLKLDGTAIAGVRIVNEELVREVLEDTVGADDGNQSMHGEPARRARNFAIEGLLQATDEPQLMAAYNANTNSAFTIETKYGKTISAADGFAMENLTFGGDEKELIPFSTNLKSSGLITVSDTV